MVIGQRKRHSRQKNKQNGRSTDEKEPSEHYLFFVKAF